MSTEENKALFRRFMEQVANRGDESVIDELMTPDFIEHQPLGPGMPPGREGVKQFFREWRAGFPDGHVTLDVEIAEGDLVTCYETWSGTHTGTFLGIPASGKQVSFAAVDIIRVADRQFVEHWGITDVMGFMEQIGAFPGSSQQG